MDAFALAQRFKDFVAEEWSGNSLQDPSDLYSYFENWTQEKEGDLVGETGGNYAMALQTWIVVSAWFAQRPEDFAAIREFVTVPIGFMEYWPTTDTPHDVRMAAQGLPGLLNEGEWRRQVFLRMSPPREKSAASS